MKFSVFFEIEVLPHLYTEAEMIERCLQQMEIADDLGFDAAWTVEHHFTPEYSHSTSPEMFFAAASQRTKQIRMGAGVELLPLHHPIHLAQRWAWLDVLSGGRVNMGIGRGAMQNEFDLFRPGMFENHHLESRAMFFEWIEILKKAWTEDTFSFDGKFSSFEDAQPLPKPIQKPHPPFYAAGGSPDSFVLYAQKGMRMLGQAAVKPLFMAMEEARTYHQSWNAAGHDPKEAEFGLLWGTHCAATNEEALKTATDPVMWYVSRLQRFFGPRSVNKEKIAEFKGYDWWTDPSMDKLVANDMVLAGDPDHCTRLIQKAESAGINHILCQFQIGGLRHEQAVESMQLFAREVMPEFKA